MLELWTEVTSLQPNFPQISAICPNLGPLFPYWQQERNKQKQSIEHPNLHFCTKPSASGAVSLVVNG
jgi:hypothetical protein